NSPQTLMLSGIGDPEELGRHGIEVKVPLPGVGRNLQDHLSVGVEYSRTENGPFQKMMRYDRIAREFGKAIAFGTGFATDLPSGWTAFVKTDPSVKLPDVQLLFRAG